MSRNSEIPGNSKPAVAGDLADTGSLNTGTPGEQGPPSVNEIRETFGGQPAGDQARETFAETLAAVAEAGRSLMRPTPLAEIGALRRHRRTRRTALTASLAAVATCAVAAGVTIAVSPGATKPMPPGARPTIAVASSTSPRPSSTPGTGTVPPTSATPGTAVSPPPGPSSSTVIPNTAFVTSDQVPFPDGGPWKKGGESQAWENAVHDVCASAWDPVDTTSKPGHPAPDSLQFLYGSGNEADVTPAMETVHVFASADDATLAYQKAKSLDAAQTCDLTAPSVGDNTRTIARGGTIGVGAVQGFAVGGSDNHPGAPDIGTTNHFRTYVVVKGNTIAVLMVPVTKDHATDSTQDKTTLTAIASHLP